MQIPNISPLTTQILSLPVQGSPAETTKPTQPVQAELDTGKPVARYDTFEPQIQQTGGVSEDSGTYTRVFQRTQSGQISALLDDPLDDPPAIVIAPSPEELEMQRLGKEYGDAMRSWNAKVDELKATVKARNYGYNETIKLFKEGYADWKANLKKANPEVYLLWMERGGESE